MARQWNWLTTRPPRMQPSLRRWKPTHLGPFTAHSRASLLRMGADPNLWLRISNKLTPRLTPLGRPLRLQSPDARRKRMVAEDGSDSSEATASQVTKLVPQYCVIRHPPPRACSVSNWCSRSASLSRSRRNLDDDDDMQSDVFVSSLHAHHHPALAVSQSRAD
ncbi:hypothetical protein N658DRAFT_20288 [Parathielavia hyrcaniae]|uniref:Uncharacterized protein n=1 Tax=Parathielavia hyrcaniae TaxID=113614 RepID=A0AAN6QA86_9PEZI|nr:hypothetical protein N658DRAFT_20288 [Parathielavia hyrcaniae]